MIGTIGLCLVCFIAGIAVKHTHQGDPTLSTFADAAVSIVAIPFAILKGLVNKAREVKAQADEKSPRQAA
jgi:hypothetical protein